MKTSMAVPLIKEPVRKMKNSLRQSKRMNSRSRTMPRNLISGQW